MPRRSVIVLLILILLAVPNLADAAEPFQRLERRSFQGESITGARHSHPVRSPADLELFFGTAEISGYGLATPILYWKSRCNGHDYFLGFVHHRLHTSAQISTKNRCTGQPHREERWLEDFFAANLDWTLALGRLTLTSGERSVVLDGKWLSNTRSRPSR